MRVKGFDGREYPWNFHRNVVKEVDTQARSSYHNRARTLIRAEYPMNRLMEEVILPGSITESNGLLSLDFFVPNLRMGVEVHGEQHFKFIEFFHTNKQGFMKGQLRDNQKFIWCEMNNIRLIVLPHWETDDEWRHRLNGNTKS